MGSFLRSIQKGISAAVLMTFIGIPAFADDGASGQIYLLISTHKSNELAQVPLPFQGDIIKNQQSYVRHPSAIHPQQAVVPGTSKPALNVSHEILTFQGDVMTDSKMQAPLPLAKKQRDTLAFQEDVVKPIDKTSRRFSIPHVVVSMR